MQVVFIYGPPAAGKHTIGSLLSERTGLPLFHNHLTVDLAKTLFEFGTEGFKEIRAGVWRMAFAAAVRADRSFIFTFNPEATVDPQLITDLIAIVESGGGQVHFVELACPKETILQRIGNASRARFGKLTDARVYEQFDREGGFNFPPLPKALLTVDTSAKTAAESAEIIEQALSAL